MGQPSLRCKRVVKEVDPEKSVHVRYPSIHFHKYVHNLSCNLMYAPYVYGEGGGGRRREERGEFGRGKKRKGKVQYMKLVLTETTSYHTLAHIPLRRFPPRSFPNAEELLVSVRMQYVSSAKKNIIIKNTKDG